jgi:hypothetical protein
MKRQIELDKGDRVWSVFGNGYVESGRVREITDNTVKVGVDESPIKIGIYELDISKLYQCKSEAKEAFGEN